MTFDELDEIFDGDWNDAVERFEAPEDSETNEESFQDALRIMVKDLQRLAFDRGMAEASSAGERITVRLRPNQTKELLRAMVSDVPISIDLIPFE